MIDSDDNVPSIHNDSGFGKHIGHMETFDHQAKISREHAIRSSLENKDFKSNQKVGGGSRSNESSAVRENQLLLQNRMND